MREGDLVRDKQIHSLNSSHYDDYDYTDYAYGYGKGDMPPSPIAVFIKWHIVSGFEEGEYYSCAKVLWFNGETRNILRHNLEVVSASR